MSECNILMTYFVKEPRTAGYVEGRIKCVASKKQKFYRQFLFEQQKCKFYFLWALYASMAESMFVVQMRSTSRRLHLTPAWQQLRLGLSKK